MGDHRTDAAGRRADAPRQKRQRAAPVRKNESHVGTSRQCPAKKQAGDGARGVETKFLCRHMHTGHYIHAAVQECRMCICNSFPPLQFIEHRCEGRVAQIFAVVIREKTDAVGVKRVERVFDFLQAAVLVRQWNRREESEAPRIVAHHFRRVLVAFARQLAASLHAAEHDSRRRNGNNRGAHAVFVHVVKRPPDRPVHDLRNGADFQDGLTRHFQILWRHQMMVYVHHSRARDAACASSSSRLAPDVSVRHQLRRAQRSKRAYKTTPGNRPFSRDFRSGKVRNRRRHLNFRIQVHCFWLPCQLPNTRHSTPTGLCWRIPQARSAG